MVQAQMQGIAWKWIHRENFLAQGAVIVLAFLFKLADILRPWVFPQRLAMHADMTS